MGLGPQLLFLYLVALSYYTRHYDLLWHFDSQVIKNQVKEKAIFLGGRILKFKCNTETGKDDRSYFLDEGGPNILYCSIFRYEWGSCENISSWLGIKISRYFAGPRHNIWDKNIGIPNISTSRFFGIYWFIIDISWYFGPLNAGQAILWDGQHKSDDQSSKMCWFFLPLRGPKRFNTLLANHRSKLAPTTPNIYSLKFII